MLATAVGIKIGHWGPPRENGNFPSPYARDRAASSWNVPDAVKMAFSTDISVGASRSVGNREHPQHDPLEQVIAANRAQL